MSIQTQKEEENTSDEDDDEEVDQILSLEYGMKLIFWKLEKR